MDFLSDLRWRGLVEDHTPGLEEALARGPVTGYIGFDPTASSLHVGSLLPVLALARLQRAGHRPIALVGGGTGLIGDPSGKKQERTLLSLEQVAENVAGLRAQLERYLDFSGPSGALLLDNAEWLGSISLMDFLRDIGKHFSVNQMMARESVRRRLESEEGISFTEFAYMLLQAYDFRELHQRHGCTLQMGGSDQWGNILSGVDLIRRMAGGERTDESLRAHGLVMPLVTDDAGNKFGKTEAGAVWLDPERTSPYRYYQFWLNTTDADVLRYLKYFTWLGPEELAAAEAELARAPEGRAAQLLLAREATRMTHGDDALARAERTSEVLFGGGDLESLEPQDLAAAFEDAPSSELPRTALDGDGLPLADLLATTSLAGSKGEARRLIKGGGVYLNNRRMSDEGPVTAERAVGGEILLLRKGKKHYHLVRLTG